jgi:3-deoxy-D-manno-octulosonic-acid transferase
MRALYVVFSYLAFAALFPLLLLHRKTRSGLLQRFGFYPLQTLPAGGCPRIWLHGASAGDLLALSPMIRLLRLRFPGCKVVLSTVTNTGYMMASERLASDVDAVIYAPYDLWGSTRRAARAIKPDLLVLEYTEIWPNLIRAAKRLGARVVLANGRFSPKHLRKYRALFTLIGNPLRDIDLFLMREDDEAERALGLGAPLERVWVTGNTKFDALASFSAAETPGGLRGALNLSDDARVLIAGSTHEGEEEKILQVYRRLLDKHPDLRLLIAPRYIDRANRVAVLAHEAKFSVGLRSNGNPQRGQVIILDTIGELSQAYRLATLVFVGGSFTRRGGQNILEPAAQGRPVLFGPHMENFRDSVQVLVGRGGIQVNDPEHLYRVIAELLDRPETAIALGKMAELAVRQVSGASLRNIEQIERLLAGLAGDRSSLQPCLSPPQVSSTATHA